ncbi:hypothetical protein Q0590_25615 [Rhodocytophaga aerolata]|uniref:Carboxypeptidase regulatory-like domain-containing protein n=1 Tax=Rhodocytophaga aerolata TaxID=455078 RepID=A0ABT8RD88_9BACT|nr:hypothetical protein [Rhodocytophaga aerolata]MDO1449681.1 hypothetical protein [Rhodocytophaga aerolata]
MKSKILVLIVLLSGIMSCDKDDVQDFPSTNDEDKPTWGKPTPPPVINGEAAFKLSGDEDYVNVMENYMPKTPTFPKVQAKEGKLIGYVADLTGKPLQGAYIGVRSTVVGGSYSSASAETDENGYYEVLVPFGAAEIWAAGCSITYRTGKAGIGLYPADGKVESFESTKGLVKNFVLLTYGLADEDERAEKPWSSGGYFGGSLYINYDLGDPDDMWATPGSLPYNAEIEIKLTPDGETLYGEAKTFTVTKMVGTKNFTINNLPVGRYTISAQLKDGRQLKLRQTGPYASLYPHHGLKPKEALGTTKVWFTPMGVEAKSGSPNYGNWRPVDIKVELP